jgi:integrase
VEGHLRQRNRGHWELIVDIGRDPLSGRRRQRSRTVHGTKREAQRELRRLITEVEDGQVTGTETTLGDLLDRWLDLADDRLSPTTLREYRRLTERRIKPALGRVPLIKLGTQDLDAFYQALANDAGLSPASVRQVHSIVRRGLKQGIKWGWIGHNVAVNASPPILRQKRITPPSVDELRSLAAAADAHSELFGLVVRVAMATGIRRGEVCGLQWRDLDVAGRQLEVARAVAATPGGAAPKTPKSGRFRRLSLDDETVQRLVGYRAGLQAIATGEGFAIPDDGYIFSHSLDGAVPLHPDNVTAAFRGSRTTAACASTISATLTPPSCLHAVSTFQPSAAASDTPTRRPR